MKISPKLLSALSLSLFLGACATEPSIGDRLIAQGESTRAQGQQWNKGNAMITEGEKQKKRGREMVEDGEKLIKKGTKNIEQGSALKAKAGSAAPGDGTNQ